MDIIKRDIVPKIIFSCNPAQDNEPTSLTSLFAVFRNNLIRGQIPNAGNKGTYKLPNLILMQMEVKDETVTFGAYSSHAWVGDDHRSHCISMGDSTCFLFNLNDNLRFTVNTP